MQIFTVSNFLLFLLFNTPGIYFRNKNFTTLINHYEILSIKRSGKVVF